MTDTSAGQPFSALRLALRSEPNVRFALLFGSTSSGRATQNSDVDLLVALRDSSLDRVLDLDLKIGQALARRVDITRLEDAASEPSFLGEALTSGSVLLDRDHIWPRLRAEAAALLESGHTREAERTRAALDGIDRLLAS
jgi:predicted nucleotidyltransferase